MIKIDTLSKLLKELFKKVILLFLVCPIAHTYSIILNPLLVCSYLYYYGNSNISSNFTY